MRSTPAVVAAASRVSVQSVVSALTCVFYFPGVSRHTCVHRALCVGYLYPSFCIDALTLWQLIPFCEKMEKLTGDVKQMLIDNKAHFENTA